ncbi:ABC transporter permease subunit [Microtetraspora malaysiensis]|uniref:ABC transporter permease subunit n=1 Tax=Microtetraspora malaysiensis TaxID=161358 RepID=UPI000832A34A|nr:ABC transporter permease subunit [Microtetraspora malaysiensis]
MTTARFRDLLAAEWIKLWSLRSTSWLIGLGTLAIVGFAANSSLDAYNSWPDFTEMEKARFTPLNEAFSALAASMLVIGAGSLGALTIVGEYTTGLIRTTLAAVPARHRVVAAKLTVTAAVTLATGTLISAGTFGVSQAILSGRGVAASLGDPGVLRVLAANALLAPVSALVGMGIGALVRHTAAAVVTVCAALVIVPTFFKPTVHQWQNDLFALVPFYVWRNCLHLPQLRDDPALPTVAGSWAVFALWPLAAAVATLIVVQRRDV